MKSSPFKRLARLSVAVLMATIGYSQRYSDNPGNAWPATDELGRTLPGFADVGPPRPDHFVGIFYFLWLGQHDQTDDKPYVVTDILRRHPDALDHPSSPPWGPASSPHFWGEPLFGFYLNSDPWVLRRHAHLLADAGVDTLIFDTTNRATYHDVYLQLCKVFRQVRAEGGRTPQIVFMVNTDAGETAQELYEDLYKPGFYSELWFRWGGKPLLICDPEKASPEVRSFFTLRRAHWPFKQVNTAYAWHWESAYPQVYGFTDDPRKPEEVNVAVAQNLRQSDGVVTNMSNGDARGRSFHQGAEDRAADAVNHGYNVQEQWDRAKKLDPPFVMVTGWNEWIAGRFTSPAGKVVFVDQFSQEFSRDIEMMRGGHNDNYYYQLVANVRQFKGMPALRNPSKPKTIPPGGGFYLWRDVEPEYADHVAETEERNYSGVGKLHYTNRTGRNDFELMKVARDETNIYFYARTRQPITVLGSAPLTLLIDSDANATSGWHGYNFRVQIRGAGRGQADLERYQSAMWHKVASIEFKVEDAQLQLAVPRSVLAFNTNQTCFDFKWADNLQQPNDIMDFYLSGDVAPDARFNYRYLLK